MAGKPKKPEPVKAHCPKCDGETNCDVHGHVYKPWYWSDRDGNSMSGGVDHSLLECRGCETVFYLDDSWNDNDLDHWYDHRGELQAEATRTKVTHPTPDSKTRPLWLDAMHKVDGHLHRILHEMYVAYDNHAFILTCVGLRTALDYGTEFLGIESSLSFEKKLAALQTQGFIGDTEHEILKVVTEAGNAAAHRAWSPDAHQMLQLLQALEVFLQRAFIYGKKALSIADSIPPRPKREKVPLAPPLTALPAPAQSALPSLAAAIIPAAT